MTRDMSWHPVRKSSCAPKRLQWGMVLIGLVAINVGVVLYHGDPRLRAGDLQTSSRAKAKAKAKAKARAKPPEQTGLASTPSWAAESRVAPPADPIEEPAAAAEPSWGSGGPRVSATVQVPFLPPVDEAPVNTLHSTGVKRLKRVQLRRRQTPGSALAALGIASDEIYGALASLKPWVDFRRMGLKDTLVAGLSQDNRLVSLKVLRGPLERARTRFTPEGWQAKPSDVEIDTMVSEISGQVRLSLWDTLIRAGEDPRLIQALVDIFAYVIDFYTEIHPDDSFYALVEKRYINGQFLDYGDILAAEFVTSDRHHRAFLYRHSEGQAAYYDDQGHSLRKQLLKSPLKYAHVTSRFGSRRHPILGYRRNHNGVDYGMPAGTPVWSVGEGWVKRAGWVGGFGLLVEISHPNGWLSQYAHLSRIFVRSHSRVQQKDIIGQVGQTGLATGPHLHYGLKKNGRYVNALQQKFGRSKALEGEVLEAFHRQVSQRMHDLNRMRIAQQAGQEEGAPKG